MSNKRFRVRVTKHDNTYEYFEMEGTSRKNIFKQLNEKIREGEAFRNPIVEEIDDTDTIIYDENGLTVGALLELLKDAPRDAKVLLNHKVNISNPEDDGSYSVGWVFDEIVEGRVEEIIDKERYPEWKVDNKIVWLTHNFA